MMKSVIIAVTASIVTIAVGYVSLIGLIVLTA